MTAAALACLSSLLTPCKSHVLIPFFHLSNVRIVHSLDRVTITPTPKQKDFPSQLMPSVIVIRVNENRGGTPLEFSMRTAMHGTSCISSAISVCFQLPKFHRNFVTCSSSLMRKARSTGCGVTTGEKLRPL